MNAVLNQNKHLWTGGLGGKYWQQSRRPLVSLAFILPLLALYEGGVLLLGPSAIRNGADVWLRQLLDQLGLGPARQQENKPPGAQQSRPT